MRFLLAPKGHFRLRLPNGGTLIVKELFWSRLQRDLVHITDPVFNGAHEPDSHDRRQKPEQTSGLSRNLIRRRIAVAFFLILRFMGYYYLLTNVGHMDFSRIVSLVHHYQLVCMLLEVNRISSFELLDFSSNQNQAQVV